VREGVLRSAAAQGQADKFKKAFEKLGVRWAPQAKIKGGGVPARVALDANGDIRIELGIDLLNYAERFLSGSLSRELSPALVVVSRRIVRTTSSCFGSSPGPGNHDKRRNDTIYEQSDSVEGTGTHRGYFRRLYKNGDTDYGPFEETHKTRYPKKTESLVRLQASSF
jgi:hypothetical protein